MIEKLNPREIIKKVLYYVIIIYDFTFRIHKLIYIYITMCFTKLSFTSLYLGHIYALDYI